ncbi:hypothetical protein ACFL3C_02540 [Patescibacteria group bacterium]
MNRFEVMKKQTLKGAAEARYIRDLSETKESRNSYTQSFLTEKLPSSIKPDAFLVKACKALGIKPSKDRLVNVISIQNILGFPDIPKGSRSEPYGYAEYKDGKLGPYTLQYLLQHKKGKELKAIFPEYQKDKRKKFAKKSGLPPAPVKKPLVKKAPVVVPPVAKLPKTQKRHPEIKGKAKRVAYIADSNGGKWFVGGHLNTINKRPTLKIVGGGKGSLWAKNRVKENIKKFIEKGVTDVVLMIGTNDMSTTASLAYVRRSVEQDPTVKKYKEIRKLLEAKGIRLHLCTIPPLGGYVARKYREKRRRLSGLKAAYWRTKYWKKVPRVYKRRYNNDPIAYYKAAEQACYTRWLNVNHWIMAQKRHINFGNARTVTLPKSKSNDGIHITGKAERRRMAKKIKDRFA